MADFFQLPQDEVLLHESIRDHDELQNIVDKVEKEIIHFYKQRPSRFTPVRSGRENLDKTPNQIEVRLYDWKGTDSPEDLKADLKETIADVASFVMRNYDNAQSVSQIQQGQRSITYARANDWRSWPDGWNYRLKNWDNREANFGI
jgi:hypothetical protein